MENLKKEDVHILLKLLLKDGLFDREHAESMVHAFVDIKESIDKIYDNILPKIIERNTSITKDQLMDNLWEIRENFRHIDYHIKDSKITSV